MHASATTVVSTRSLTVPGSVAGPASALPALRPVRGPITTRLGPGADDGMRERVARGRLNSPLPYGVHSDYDRGDRPVEVPVVELDNGLVRAVVAPTLGGRVWSLTDIATNRELLHRNPVLRWANFGLTDAWFAGGIEWNLGSTGHATTSNLPMNAALVGAPQEAGSVVLRLWEWERTRDLILQVDLWLSGRRLMASTRVTNVDPQAKPLYYWTNMAAPQTPGTRVLVPATHAWRTDYTGILEKVAVPHPDGATDISVPDHSEYAADYFYEVEDQVGRVVTAIEPDGHGIGQTSTRALRGRKLFLWGHGPGGQRWQDWLSVPGSRYLEIQAGYCPTQLEHDLIAGNATVSWTEVFGAVHLDPALVAADYPTASAAAAAAVHDLAGPDWLEAQHDQWLTSIADAAPESPMHTGSGWGAAELALRDLPAPTGTPFPEIDDDSTALRHYALTRDVATLAGISPERPTLPPVSQRWLERFAATTQADDGSDQAGTWWVHYAMATAWHCRGEDGPARTAYARSVALRPNPMALRGLAALSADPDERRELYRQATDRAPHERRLLVERLVDLLDSDRGNEAIEVIAAAPQPLRDHGRICMLHARALVALGDGAGADGILRDLEVPDLAEGELTLSQVWAQLHPDRPLPARLDFTMAPSAGLNPPQ